MTNAKRALAGAAVWLGFVAAVPPRPANDAWGLALLVFAALVLVPLALDLIVERNDAAQVAGWLRWVRHVQFWGAASLAFACYLPAGPLAAAFALPWLGVTLLLAAIGIMRVIRHGAARPLDRLCVDAALVFAAIGGLWTVADRVGYGPLKFDRAIVALTAVHFHYAGLLLPLCTGLVARRMPESRFVARVAVGVVLGVPAVAVGITATQLGTGPAFEAAAGVGLALAAACVAIFHVRLALEPATPKHARALLGIAGASLFFGMVLAALYALRGYAAPIDGLGLPQMRAIHGTINAVGFGLCGLLGWRRALLAPT